MYKKYLKKILVIFFVVCLFVGIIPAINFSENIVLAAALEGGYENEDPSLAPLIENLSQEVKVYNPWSAGTGKTLFKFVASSSGQYRITLSSADNTFSWILYEYDYPLRMISNAADVSSMDFSFDAVNNQTFILQLYGASSDFTATLNIIPPTPAPTYTITAIDNQTLTALTAGYTSGTQQTKTVTIERTGTGDLANLATALSGANADSFTITQPEVTTLNSGNPSTTFTVKAKDGLVAGTYTATVTVSATNMTNMTFTVTQLVGESAPAVTAVNIDPGTYGPATDLGFMVRFSEPVDIDTTGGVPYLDINIGGVQRRASFYAKNGAADLLFRYDILPSDPTDIDGITMGTTLNLNGGTIKSAADSDNASTTLSFIDDLTHVYVDTTGPTVSSAAIEGTNDYVLVTLSEDVHNGMGGPVNAAAFGLIFDQNSGNATNVVISSITAGNGSPLDGTDQTLRFYLNITGTPSGIETVEIKPVLLVCDVYGNAMSAMQSTGTLELNDETPDLTAPIAGNGGTVTNTAKSSSSVTIAWTAATDDVTAQNALEYTVRRSTTNLGTNPVAISNGAVTVQGWTTNITSYTASGLNANTTYYFYVGVRDMAGKNTLYTPIAVTTDAVSDGGSGGSGGSKTPTIITKIESGDSVIGANLDNLVKEGKKLTVEGKAGEKLVLDTEALKNIDGQTKDSLKLEIKDVSTNYKNEHPDRLVVSLTITAGGKHITNFGNGTATVSLPYELKAGEKAEDVTVWYLAEDGTMTEVPCTYDETTKLATFKVSHFSLYVVGTADTNARTNPFGDVKESSWFYDAVRYVSANGLMNGTTDTAFNPGAKTTRGMIVAILWRMENEPKASKEMTFADVKDGKYYHDAVAWASEKGIVGGYSAEKFGPEDNITREQLAVILHNYAASKGYNMSVSGDLSAFGDSSRSHSWSKEALSWANAEGLINGTGSNLLDPLGAAERCQVAATLQRFVENTVE